MWTRLQQRKRRQVLLVGEEDLVIVAERVDEMEGISLVTNGKRLLLDDVKMEVAKRTKWSHERLSTDDLGRFTQTVGLVVML